MVTEQDLKQLYIGYFGKPADEGTTTGREVREVVIHRRERYQDEVMAALDFGITEARIILTTMRPDMTAIINEKMINGKMLIHGHMTVCFPDSNIAKEYEKGTEHLTKWAAELIARLPTQQPRTPKDVAEERRKRLLGRRGRW